MKKKILKPRQLSKHFEPTPSSCKCHCPACKNVEHMEHEEGHYLTLSNPPVPAPEDWEERFDKKFPELLTNIGISPFGVEEEYRDITKKVKQFIQSKIDRVREEALSIGLTAGKNAYKSHIAKDIKKMLNNDKYYDDGEFLVGAFERDIVELLK